MTKEEMQELMKGAMEEAVAPIKADIENLKKSVTPQPAPSAGTGDTDKAALGAEPITKAAVESSTAMTKEDVAEIVKSAVAESVKPLREEVDLIKKSGFMRAITESQGQKVEKSVWTGSGLIPGR